MYRILALGLFFTTAAHAEDWRPYVFSLEGDTLAGKHAAFESGVGYNGVTGSGGGLSPDDAHRIQTWLYAGVGITDWLEMSGALQFADNLGQNFGFSQARVDLRARLLRPRGKVPIAISLGLGYQADTLLENALTATFAISAYLGRVDLTLNVRAAHYFHAGRDPVDFFVTFGALVRTTRWLHLGVEYVGEEIEAVFGDDEDVGGYGRHYLGPTAALRFWDNRIRVNATVGCVFMKQGDGALARGSLAYLF
jgi:hypothetical protein